MSISEYQKDYLEIVRLQVKYQALLKEHMSKKKAERNADWEKDRTQIFHLSGALSMTRAAFSKYK